MPSGPTAAPHDRHGQQAGTIAFGAKPFSNIGGAEIVVAGRADPRTTQLYNRRKIQVTRNLVERISYLKDRRQTAYRIIFGSVLILIMLIFETSGEEVTRGVRQTAYPLAALGGAVHQTIR